MAYEAIIQQLQNEVRELADSSVAISESMQRMTENVTGTLTAYLETQRLQTEMLQQHADRIDLLRGKIERLQDRVGNLEEKTVILNH